jgi:hypothetical protein
VALRPHRSALNAATLAALILVAGCQSASPEPSPTGQPATQEPSDTVSSEARASESAEADAEVSVFDLEIGHCFSADAGELETVTVVDCDREHHYEVFAVLDHPAGSDEPFPGDSTMLEYADTACQEPFEPFVGRDYLSSIWYITSLPPTEGTWADGDREIICTLNQQDDAGDPITVSGSAEGSGE